MSAETRKSRSRRWAWRLLVAAVVLLVAAALLVEFLFDTDRYRRMGERALADATGLPVSIGGLDIDLLPMPKADVSGVVIGEGEFRLEAPAVTVGFDFAELFSGGNAVGRVELGEVAVYVPASAEVLADRLNEVKAAFSGRTSQSSRELPLELHRVHCERMVVHRGGVPWVTGSWELLDALAPNPALRFEADCRALPVALSAKGEAQLNLKGGEAPLAAGTMDLDLPDLTPLIAVEDPLSGSIQAAFEVYGPADCYAGLNGTVQHGTRPPVKASGRVWWRDGEWIVNEAEVTGPDVQLMGDAMLTPGAPLAVRVTRFDAGWERLGDLLARAGATGAPNGGLVLENLVASFPKGAPPRLVSGSGQARGVSIPAASLDDASATFTVTENVFTIERAGNEGCSFTGTLSPDFDAGTAHLSGALRLDPGAPDSPLRDRIPPWLSFAGAEFSLEELTCTLSRAPGIPRDLRYLGKLQAETVRVQAGAGPALPLTGLSCTVAGDAEKAVLAARAESETLGPVSANGTCTLSNRDFTGTLGLDVARVMALVAPEGTLNPYLKGVCSGYGDSVFEVGYSFGQDRAVRLVRRGAPFLDLALAFSDQGVQSVHGAGETDLAWFAPALPERVRAAGPAPVVFDLRAAAPGAAGQFSLDINLNAATIGVGEYVEKRADDHAAVLIEGTVEAGRFTPRRARVAVLGETVDVGIGETSVAVPDFEVRLERLVQLLPAEATAAGVLSGSVSTRPLAVDLHLAGAGFGVSPSVKIDALDGRIYHREGDLRVENLHMLGADSDCTVNAGLVDGKWSGRILGEKLNLNAIEVMHDAARALYVDKGRPEAPEPVRRHRLVGEASVDVSHLYYRRGRLDRVTGRLVFEPTRIALRDLSCLAGQGLVRGKVILSYATDTVPASLAAQLEAEGIDLHVVDDFLLELPRGMRGTADVNLAVTWPLGTGKPPQFGMDGAVVFAARDGNYGQLAHGNALLSVLKTTNLFRLKLPNYRDTGLTFQRSAGRINIEQGVFTVSPFTLDGGSHAMTGNAVINYPEDTVQGEIRFYVLEGVTGLVGKVPGLGGAAQSLKKRAGLRVQVSGSPDAPRFGRPEETRFEESALMREGRESIEQGATAVEDALRAGARGLEGLLGRGGE